MPMEQQLLDRITLEDRKALLEVCGLLSKVEQAWHRIDSGKRCELNAMHHEESSLAYCLRWGMQAVDELIELTQGVGKPI
ncbi:hypothetical protein [Dechloromonas sp. CZR5]|uniref:hypothetical protein n=1 Tax=Dechloromonas sp. CZR5 TaxID=2608630 RepID=UPI00123CD873|nr:hypothetical protein [Dechloromonas sp. CZR5]